MNHPPVSTFTGSGAIAVTPHHLATEAALDAMRSGGTAADAVIAANAVLGMVLPTTCGIGGDLFAMIHKPGWNQPEVLNASGRGGSNLDAAALRTAGNEEFPPLSPQSITVPGCVDGWEALADRHGTQDLATLMEPAIRLGHDGFTATPELSAALGRLEDRLTGQGSSPPLYPGGSPPEPGATLRRPDLAATMEAIAEKGRDAFYAGPVAEAIVTASEHTLTTPDLELNRPDWVEPLGTELFGLDAWTIPPNSQGYLTLAAGILLEELAPDPDPEDPAFHHALIEAYRAVAWERNDLVADPERLTIDASQLLDRSRILERADRLAADTVTRWPTPGPAPGGTAYFCAIDEAGMAVSCIQSNFWGIGAAISARDTGVFLHNRGAGFSLGREHPNEARPGARPLHTLAPTLWTRDGEPALLLGTRGGHQQPQYLLQVAALLLLCGKDPGESQGFPRWSNDEARHAGNEGSVVSVESRMAEGVVSGLRSRGHVVTTVPDFPPGWGPVSLIANDRSGTRTGAADPRVSSANADGL